MWLNLQKGGLIHVSNFLTLRLASIGPTALKFGSRTFLSMYGLKSSAYNNSVFTNEVMPCQSWKIGCMYKTPFANSVAYIHSYYRL